MYRILFVFACAFFVPAVRTQYYNQKYEYPPFYDFSGEDDSSESDQHYGPPSTKFPLSDRPLQSNTRPTQTMATTPPTSPRMNILQATTSAAETVKSRLSEDMSNVQQTQVTELHCLEVLDGLVAARWQEDIDKLSVSDLGSFPTDITVPRFLNLYSNPESEWVQEEGAALEKLDKCVKNLVSTVAPRMNPEEIACLIRMYPDYLTREIKTAELWEKLMNESSAEPNIPFRSFFSYSDITQVLFDNKDPNELDHEVRSTYDFYIKTKKKHAVEKIFVIEQECEWKNVRFLSEVDDDDIRYQRFAQLVRTLTNRYLVSEILHRWVPGTMIPEYRYNLWNKVRASMDDEILAEQRKAQSDKKDAQFLCTYAAELATKFYAEQRAVLFDKMQKATVSYDLKTHYKYSYIVALKDLLSEKTDSRLAQVQVLVNEFKDGYYCLTNLIRLVENHQRYMIANSFVNQALPYGLTYCLMKENSAGLVNPRYCKCQGTFCEEFGLGSIRSHRYQLNLLPDNTYSVSTNASYRVPAFDELVAIANDRIANQIFNTTWYHNQNRETTLA